MDSYLEAWPWGYKLFSGSTQLSMKFIRLINVKMPTFVGILTMPTFVGILTFISKIITTSENFKATKVIIFHYFSFYEQLKFHALLIWARKKV